MLLAPTANYISTTLWQGQDGLGGRQKQKHWVLSPQSFLIKMYSCLPSRSTFKTLSAQVKGLRTTQRHRDLSKRKSIEWELIPYIDSCYVNFPSINICISMCVLDAKGYSGCQRGPVLFCWTCEWRLRVDFEAMGLLTEDSFLSKAQMWVCVDHEVSTHKHNRLKHIYISETLNELNLCEFYWGIVFVERIDWS